MVVKLGLNNYSVFVPMLLDLFLVQYIKQRLSEVPSLSKDFVGWRRFQVCELGFIYYKQYRGLLHSQNLTSKI